MSETAAPARPLVPCPEVLDFLLTRRSRSARTLTPDRPEDAVLDRIVAAAVRVPDHGMLVPWRLILIERPAMLRLSDAARARAGAIGLDTAAADKAAAQFTHGGAILAVVARPVASRKIPDWEQHLSAGAVCLTALNAALAQGWGANWLTGPLARDPVFLGTALGLDAGEWVAGFVHIGGEGISPAERARPDPAALLTRLAQ